MAPFLRSRAKSAESELLSETRRSNTYLHVTLDLVPSGLDVAVAVVGRQHDRKDQVPDDRVVPCRSQMSVAIIRLHLDKGTLGHLAGGVARKRRP